MGICPLDTVSDSSCIKEKCEWWIKHDTTYGCAVTKIAPELFELRKWLSMIAMQQKEW